MLYFRFNTDNFIEPKQIQFIHLIRMGNQFQRPILRKFHLAWVK